GLPALEDRLPRPSRLGGCRARHLARRSAGERAARLLPGRDPALARGVPAAFLHQPVQALDPAEWPEDLVGRLALAARRLAGPVRCRTRPVARRTRAGAAARLTPQPCVPSKSAR